MMTMTLPLTLQPQILANSIYRSVVLVHFFCYVVGRARSHWMTTMEVIVHVLIDRIGANLDSISVRHSRIRSTTGSAASTSVDGIRSRMCFFVILEALLTRSA